MLLLEKVPMNGADKENAILKNHCVNLYNVVSYVSTFHFGWIVILEKQEFAFSASASRTISAEIPPKGSWPNETSWLSSTVIFHKL